MIILFTMFLIEETINKKYFTKNRIIRLLLI